MGLLLVLIYVCFISLGLPDSLLGSAWPSIYGSLGVSAASAGIISMIICSATVLSSFFSDKLIRKLGTGLVTSISVAMTAVALLGYSLSGSFAALCLWAVPLGLGAGSVDAALNNFVALHYKAKHMNFLHCFWGLGASVGPVIMSYSLVQWASWKTGYRIISVIQFVLVAVLFVAIPLWKKAQNGSQDDQTDQQEPCGLVQLIKIPGAKAALLAFFCYCALESTVGLWASSFFVIVKAVPAETAARWVSLYYLGITLGRFVSGFLSNRFTSRQMVRLGQLVICIGVALFLIPLPQPLLLAGLCLIGLGCAPVFPSLLHQTPDNFGAGRSQSIMGIQMASAYIGSTFMPPLFGFLGSLIGYQFFPLYAAVLLIVMIAAVGALYAKTGNRTQGTRNEEVCKEH